MSAALAVVNGTVGRPAGPPHLVDQVPTSCLKCGSEHLRQDDVSGFIWIRCVVCGWDAFRALRRRA